MATALKPATATQTQALSFGHLQQVLENKYSGGKSYNICRIRNNQACSHADTKDIKETIYYTSEMQKAAKRIFEFLRNAAIEAKTPVKLPLNSERDGSLNRVSVITTIAVLDEMGVTAGLTGTTWDRTLYTLCTIIRSLDDPSAELPSFIIVSWKGDNPYLKC